MNEQQIRNRTLQHSQIDGLRLEVARLKREETPNCRAEAVQ